MPVADNCVARDYLNMDFAVAVNFEQPSGDRIKKSVMFTDGADEVEINNEQVLINNNPASLPVKSPSPPSRRPRHQQT